MKKLIMAMVLAIVTLMSATCFAGDRWYWVSSSEKGTIYVDTTSGAWDGGVLHATIKDIKPNGEYSINEIGIELIKRSFVWHIYDFWNYTPDGKLKKSGSCNGYAIHIAPDSRGEHDTYVIYSLFKGRR